MSRTKSIWEDIAINKHQTKPRTDIKNKQIAAKAQNLAKLSTSVILKLNNFNWHGHNCEKKVRNRL